MNATSATSVGRSATPSSLVAAFVSCVRPTRVRRSPRSIVVFGRMGIVVAVAPRVIFRRKTPRAAGILASSASVLPSTALLLTERRRPPPARPAAPDRRPPSRLRPEHLHEHVAGAGDRHHVALAQHGVRGRLLDRPVAADAQDEDARVGHQRLGLGGPQANSLPARLHAEGAQLPAVPGRAGAAHFLGAALLLLVVLARRRRDRCASSAGPRMAITIAEPTVPNM